MFSTSRFPFLRERVTPMEKITAMVRYYYDQEITVEVEDPEDEQAIYEKVEQLADNIKVWDGNNLS